MGTFYSLKRHRFFIVHIFAFSIFIAGCSASSGEGRAGFFGEVSQFFVRFIGGKSCKGDDRDAADSIENKLVTCNFSGKAKVVDSVYKSCIEDTFELFNEIKSEECREKYVPEIRSAMLKLLKHATDQDFRSIEGEINQNRGRKIDAEFYGSHFKKILGYFNFWSNISQKVLYRNPENETIIGKSENSSQITRSDQVFESDLSEVVTYFWIQLSSIMTQLERNQAFSVETELSSQNGNEKASGFAYLLELFRELNESATQVPINFELGAVLMDREFGDLYPRIRFFAEISDYTHELLSPQERLIRVKTPSELEMGIKILGLLENSTGSSGRDKFYARIKKLKAFPKGLTVWPTYLESVWNLMNKKDLNLNQFSLADQKDLGASVHSDQGSSHKVESLSDLADESIVVTIRPYIKWVRLFSSIAKNLKNNGLFYGEWKPVLHQGFTQSNIDNAVASLNHLDSQLNQLKLNYGNVRRDTLNRRRDDNDRLIEVNRIKKEITNSVVELVQDRANLKAKQARLARVRESSSRLLLDELFGSEKWKSRDSHGQVRAPLIRMNISGADAPADLGADDLEKLAVNKPGIFGIDAAEGDVLVFRVTDRYRPSCAISKSKYADLVGGSGVGPEGYILQVNNGQASVVSYADYHASRDFESNTNTESDSISTESYASMDFRAKMGLPGILALFSPVDLEVTAGSGVRHSSSHSSSRSHSRGAEFSSGKDHRTTDSREQRTSASFDMGIRLPDTPFPHLPAGALLLVSVPIDPFLSRRGMNIRVISHETAVVAEAASKFFLIVNDCRNDSKFSDRSLSVSFEHLINRSHEARKLADLMAGVMKMIQEKSKGILSMRSLDPTTIQSLTSSAHAMIVAAGGDFSDFPGFERIFNSWVSEEIEQLSTQIQIQQLELKIEQGLRELNQYRTSLELQEENQKLAGVLSQWSMEEFNFNHARMIVDSVLRQTRNQILPVLRVRCPKTYFEFSRKSSDLFRQVSFHDSQVKVIKFFSDLITFLKTHRETEVTGEEQIYLAINFLRLDERTQKPILPLKEILTPFSDFSLSIEPYVVLSKLLAHSGQGSTSEELCWDDLDHGRECESTVQPAIVTFKVTPEDLYSLKAKRAGKRFASGSLDCNQVYPLVRKMGVFVQFRDERVDQGLLRELNEQMKKVKFKMTSDLGFFGSDEEFSYQVSKDWSSARAPVMFGENNKGIAKFNEFQEPRLGNSDWGIVPFGEFQINLEDLDFGARPLSEVAQHILNFQLVFQASTIQSDRDAKVCRSVHR